MVPTYSNDGGINVKRFEAVYGIKRYINIYIYLFDLI